MYVEIAEIDIEGYRSTTHEFADAVSVSTTREYTPNPIDTATVVFEDGESEQITGRGFGLDVVRVEE